MALAERARQLSVSASLAGWLQKVSYRIALRAAKRRSRLREKELTDRPAQSPDTLDEISARETIQLLHEELQGLRPRYRDVIVLCDLEGNTRAAVAERLDCTEAAVRAALARARRQLRVRLLSRGVALSTAVVAAAHVVTSVHSSLAHEFLEITVAACVATTLPGCTAITCSETAQFLASKGTKMIMISAIAKPIPAVVLAIVLTAVPLIVLAQVPGDPSSNATVVESGEASDPSVAGTRNAFFRSLRSDVDEGPFKNATARKAQAAYNSAIAKVKADYVKELDKAVKESGGVGNLDEAIRIAAERKRVVTDQGGPSTSSGNKLRKSIEGTVWDGPNGWIHFHKNKKAVDSDGSKRIWTIGGVNYLILQNLRTGNVEVWEFDKSLCSATKHHFEHQKEHKTTLERRDRAAEAPRRRLGPAVGPKPSRSKNGNNL